MIKRKKNIGKKEVLSSDAGDEPCTCGHPRRSHLGDDKMMCFGCYQKKESWFHPFKLDNLTYIEKLYSRKERDKLKKLMEELKNEP